MQKLTVELFGDMSSHATIDEVSLCMDKLDRHTLHFTPWSAYPYKPDVQFSIAYAADSILLKYYTTEQSIRAAAGKINGAVWEDSCVEFFISFDEKGYYNFEFNCIGTALVGFGKEKAKRELLSEEVISKISYESKISNQNKAVHWELMLVIPFNVFVYHRLIL